jgi:CspA family cold shock protein
LGGADKNRSSLKGKEAIMTTGKVKRLVQERGFGFITADDGREIFFHRSGVEGTTFESLREGQRVSFDVEKGQKGPRAVHVQVAEAGKPS